MHTHFPRQWKPSLNSLRQRVIVPLMFTRPESVFTVTVQPAQFLFKENALFVEGVGTASVEFVPKGEKVEGGRRVLDGKQRRGILLRSEELEHFWKGKEAMTVVREGKDSHRTLTITPAQASLHLRLLISPKSQDLPPVSREDTLTPPEVWLLQQYLTVTLT